MNKAKNVVDFYVLCNKLKYVIRSGWINWGVKKDRLESVAEHIYGTQMLAISMWSEFKYDIDIKKVLTMLAVHELEEIVIGDFTQFEIDKQTKAEMGHKAVKQILSSLLSGKTIEDLILEFDERKSAEAKFAYECDKLECDIQSKLYDKENCVDLTNQQSNKAYQDPEVQKLLASNKSWSEMWILFGQNHYNYDQNFLEVSNYALNNQIDTETK